MAVGLLDDLKSIDVEVDTIMNSFMDNEELYKKFLYKFLNDNNMDLLGDKIYNKQYENLTLIAHTLKGTTAHLGLTPLYECFTKMVNELRQNEYGNIQTLYEEIVDYYERFCGILNKY